jgi:hypothetical protein
MPIVTLTTDWNKGDYYIGAVKGKILSRNNAIQIVDITHQIQPFNLMQAAFILRNCGFEFPGGTVHIVAVNAALTEKQSLLLIQKKNQVFLAADNGLAGLLGGDNPDGVYRVKADTLKSNFLSLDLFIQAACRLLDGEAIEKIGKLTTDYVTQIPFRPVIDNNLINGSVIYIDSYANAITNISKETFDNIGKGKVFEIFVQSNHHKVNTINSTYSDSPAGDLVALFNSAGLLEIAINHGNVADLLNLSINSTIRIKFYDESPKEKLTLSGN